MTELEKVIAGLESCRPGRYCGECPYHDLFDKGICNQQLEADALALLEAQMPRVMTWEEMIAAGKEEEAVFVEECPKGNPARCFWGLAIPGIDPPKDKPFNYPGGVDFNVVDSEGDVWDGDFYAMNAPLGWRAWSSRPSPEQMRETPWEGEKDD